MLAAARHNTKKNGSCKKADISDSLVKLDPDTAKYIEDKKNSKHF